MDDSVVKPCNETTTHRSSPIILNGQVIGQGGIIWHRNGKPLGKIVAGNVDSLDGAIVNQDGCVLDAEGFVIGKAEVFSKEAAEEFIENYDDALDVVPRSKQNKQGHAEGVTKAATEVDRTVTVGIDYLQKLVDMIMDLQLRLGSAATTPELFDIEGRKTPRTIRDIETGVANEQRESKIVRLKTVPEFYDDRHPLREPDDDSAPENTAIEASKRGFTILREFDVRKRFWRKKIEIASPSLIDSLKYISHYETDVEMINLELHVAEPLMVLFHNRERIKRLAGETAESTPAKEDAGVILDIMQNDFPNITQDFDDIVSENPSGWITYPNLWMLYPIGTIVYTVENGEREAFVVESIRGLQKHAPGFIGRHGHSRLDITCWSINYDGEIFGRVWSVHCIQPFHGSKEISSLPLVPERFVPEVENIKSTLIGRGKQFWCLQGQTYLEYTGEMYTQQASDDEAVRVMVDHLTYQRRNDWPITIDRKRGPSQAKSKNWKVGRFSREIDDRIVRCPPRPRLSPYYEPGIIEEPEARSNVEPYRRYDTIQQSHRDISEFTKYDSLQPDSDPDELTLLLCPQQVHGYCLRDKSWNELNVTQLRPVSFRKNAWDRLVLDAEYKDIIQAMVSSYVDKTAILDDLVAGKGKGLVALLHGPPGSGKTLTAECVADSFERPLYQVTCGDIGTDPEGLEERLAEIFDYAVTFDAILLLNEADIFLHERSHTNLKRNALVSIFLRTLEYFNGVLFLTTNSVGMFDQAFQSRIHVSLGLPSLDQHRRIAVWSIFLQDLKDRNAITEPHLNLLTQLVKEKWSKERLNGRQIRNAVRTALVIAEKKGVMVGEREFETVLRIGREFEGYMGALGKRPGVERGALEGFMEVERP